MTITLSKRIVEKSNVEVEVPSFWMNGDRLLGILNEQTVIVILQLPDYTNIVSGTAEGMKHWTEDIADYLPIDESQFFAAHENALESLSLSPKLTHKTYVEDLASIGVKTKEV
jgi:hypothetical protein